MQYLLTKEASCRMCCFLKGGPKIRARHWRLSRHVPGSTITDRWDKSPCQAWMEKGWTLMEHSTHPTHIHSLHFLLTPVSLGGELTQRLGGCQFHHWRIWRRLWRALIEIWSWSWVKGKSGLPFFFVQCLSLRVCMLSFMHQQISFFFVWMEYFLFRLRKQLVNELFRL